MNNNLLCHAPLVVLIIKLNIVVLVYLNTEISITQYMFVRFVGLVLSEDLVTIVNPTYILHM